MIYEIRTYTIPPGKVPEYYEKFGEIFEKRQAVTRMVGMFHTEVGDLNRIMHIWEYESAAHREETRKAVAQNDWWPPPTVHLIQSQVTKICTTPAFRPEPRLGEFGSIYEFRTYAIIPGKMGDVVAKWTEHIAAREELSPLSALFMTESGQLNQWIHVWAYKDPNHRAEMRAASRKLPNWPPGSRPFLQSQNTELWVPGPYSLMK